MKDDHDFAPLAIADAVESTEILANHIVHDGFRSYAVYRFHHGGMPASLERELLVTHRTAAVLPVDRASGDLVLLRQFRIGAHLSTGRGMMIEIVAGAVDPGETFEEAARRELAEETGLHALTLREAVVFLPSPGMTNEHVTLFVAAVDIAGLPGQAGSDVDERIYPFRCTLADALEAADGGAIANGFTLLALNWYARHGTVAESGGRDGNAKDSAGRQDTPGPHRLGA